MSEAPVTAPLARFIAGCAWADVPTAIRHEAKRALVNYFGVALAGARDPDVAAARSLLARFSGPADASLVGWPVRLDALSAAALNAMAANVHDYDDTHLPTIIHPTAPVAAALFALAERYPVSGEQWLLAFVLGVEVECRLGLALGEGHYRRGWHITATCGVFGAAVAAAKLLGLGEQAIGGALGNASAQACGLVETLGSAAKSLGVGNAARGGLLSALLAAEGFYGPAQPLEGERGFVPVFGQPGAAAGLLEGLGEHWALAANTYKPYPCGVVLNPVIEACLALHPRLAQASIERIELRGHPLLRQRTDRPGIRSGRQAQVSAQHAVAVSLLDGQAGLAQFSDAAVARADLRALYPRLVFEDCPEMGVEAANVRVLLHTGEWLEQHVSAALGSLQRPLPDAALETKLHTLAAPFDSTALLQLIWGLEQAVDAAAPLHLCREVTV
ncbi:MmgE/PrpD family protein [Pseudomonas sp. NPDC007930]|uniref:MmgE/PrpD family protein n=1 Tax=Pseudomonas sp. NPDC007930 TaxID=3364417 RepID=UPI0036EC0703